MKMRHLKEISARNTQAPKKDVVCGLNQGQDGQLINKCSHTEQNDCSEKYSVMLTYMYARSSSRRLV